MARGSIRKRGARSWQLVYDLPRGADGKRQQRYETVQGTKRQAEARLTQVLDSVRRDRYFEPTRLTVAEFLEQFLTDYVETNCRPRTAQGYRDIIRGHFQPSFGYVLLARLTAQEIQRYYAGKLRAGLSTQTVTHHHTLLHRALEVAIDWDLLERNPSDRIHPPRPGPSPARTLDLEEVRRLLAAAQPTDYHMPVHLALYAGLRRSEVLGLRWPDVNIDSRTLTIQRALHYLKGQGYHWGEPKSRRSNRTVAIPQVTALLLRSQRERSQAAHQDRAVPDDLEQVCAFPDGRLMKPDGLSHAFSRIASRAGIEGVRFHDLRHTHASLLLGQGTPVHVVQSRLGHQSITTTVDIYGHVLAEADVAAGAAFEEVVTPNVGKMWAKDFVSRP